MSAVRHQASYNGIIFNRVYGGTDPNDPSSLVTAYKESDYRLEVFDDSPVQIHDFSEPRQNQEGSEPNEAFESLRLVRGSGHILGSSYADLEDKVWALKAAFSVAEVRRLSTAAILGTLPDEPVGVLPFKFTRDTAGGTKDLLYYARPQTGRPSLIVAAKGGLVRPFTFQLAAFDPRAYENDTDDWESTALSNLAGGNNTITNLGTAVMYPQIKFDMSGSGSATVTLTNVTTGNSFVLDLSSQSGDFWMMCEKGEILKASDRAARYYLKKHATKFLTNLFLNPGANIITLVGSTGITSVTFYFKSAYA
ncbi:MAG: hypothetical protein DRH30_00495 [Deltaproteobacteria bacterium]|nr:MAG: hypothetical protein DRH30_00495 [Deltaproteobacteria bacterium]